MRPKRPKNNNLQFGIKTICLNPKEIYALPSMLSNPEKPTE